MTPWPVQMQAERLVLELREILVRHDENLKANTLMQECVPYFIDDARHPAIMRARADQAAMVDHIVGNSYRAYYETNIHERPFEEQCGISPEEAHEHLYRVKYLRDWLLALTEPIEPLEGDAYVPHLLDLACNDGWMAQNLTGLAIYDGLDLNPDCIERAKARDVPAAKFIRAAAEDAEVETWPLREPAGYDVVVCFELIEHVRDPDAVLAAMVACCKPGGSLFVSTPLGACTDGDLSDWWHVEPKGHVRVFTPQTFFDLLARYGDVADLQGSETERLMVARVTVPG